LVYLQYISAKIHSKCASQPKISQFVINTISNVVGYIIVKAAHSTQIGSNAVYT